MENKSFKANTLFSLLIVNFILRFISLKYNNISIGWKSWIKSPIHMGRGSGCGWGFVVRGSGQLNIGNFCAIGENVRIITSNHESNRLSLNYKLQDKLLNKRFINNKMGVNIGNDVWIGDQVMILPGVNIGNGVIIAASAVVTKDIPPYSIVAGVPARIIKSRFSSDLINKLEEIRWWDWSEDELYEKRHLFLLDLTSQEDIRKIKNL
jgi:virginiamycin A acetyltransferase